MIDDYPTTNNFLPVYGPSDIIEELPYDHRMFDARAQGIEYAQQRRVEAMLAGVPQAVQDDPRVIIAPVGER